MTEVFKKSYSFAEINYEEVARYSGAKETDENLKELMRACALEAENENAIDYKVCYAELPLEIIGLEVKTPPISFLSRNLARLLSSSKGALVFASTLGIGVDRLIKKYSETNPSKALIFQALGAERIETFTDIFLKDYEKSNGVSLTPRFSPGYGDLPLEAQRDIFALLNPSKLIGVTLNDSLIMSPSKSITAIAGIGGEALGKFGCENCEKKCGLRR